MPRHIGTLGEKSLHAALKAYYAQPGDRLESELDGYVIDILRPEAADPRCIEIQTRHLGGMKPKLTALLDRHTIQVVHPIAQTRTITRINADGEIVSRRKSPKRGTVYDLFAELVRLPGLVQHPNFRLEALLIHEEQVWIDDGLAVGGASVGASTIAVCSKCSARCRCPPSPTSLPSCPLICPPRSTPKNSPR